MFSFQVPDNSGSVAFVFSPSVTVSEVTALLNPTTTGEVPELTTISMFDADNNDIGGLTEVPGDGAFVPQSNQDYTITVQAAGQQFNTIKIETQNVAKIESTIQPKVSLFSS